MKLRLSHILVAVAVMAASLFVVYKLNNNKKAFQENIEFAQRKIDKIPVSVEKAGKSRLSERVVATGVLEASEVLNLVSETQGKIVAIYKQKGDRVSRGDVIVKVDDEVIQANVLTAEANYIKSQKDVERFTNLAQENAIAKRDLEQAEIGLKKAQADLINAKKALSNTAIKTPISGVINNQNLTIGQFLAGGSPVCEIVNNSKLKLNIKVSEREVYKINDGQVVSLRLSAFPEKIFPGKITSIGVKADAVMKFNVEITLMNDENTLLKSGLFAEVELPIENDEKLIISKSCIVGSMENPVVFVASCGKAVKRELITGHSNNKQIEVYSGLEEGDKVIVSGQLNLKEGDEINVVQ